MTSVFAPPIFSEACALLAIDPPGVVGRARPRTPCRILDAQLQPFGTIMADGTFQPVPAGRLVLIIPTASGAAKRKVVQVQANGRYRLHYFPYAVNASVSCPSDVADEEALRTVAFLESGQIAEARALADSRLRAIRKGQMGDPVAAVVVGYVLLQTWEHEALTPWCLNLPNEHRWLADAYVLAAEWHAFAGNHLTAFNYLRQLRNLALPVFTLGVSRALERLAAYQAVLVEPATSVSTTARHTGEMRRPQNLNPWDLEEAMVAYRELAQRSGRLALDAPTTEIGNNARPPKWKLFALVINQTLKRVTIRSTSTQTKGAGDMGTEEVREQRSGLSGIPMVVAIGAVLVWVAFVVVMLIASDVDDLRWTRLTFVFASVEAIAFAAAGALFGVTVQRERVEKAEAKAEANERDASNGRALAAINLSDSGKLLEQDGESAFESFGPSDAKETEIRRRHAEAARRLFPNL